MVRYKIISLKIDKEPSTDYLIVDVDLKYDNDMIRVKVMGDPEKIKKRLKDIYSEEINDLLVPKIETISSYML